MALPVSCKAFVLHAGCSVKRKAFSSTRTEEASGFPVKHAVIARCDEQTLAGANPSVPRQSCESILGEYLKNVNEAILSDMASFTFLTCQSVQIKLLHHSLFPITCVFFSHFRTWKSLAFLSPKG